MKQITRKKQSEPITAEVLQRYINFLDCKPRTVETYTTNLKQFYSWMKQNGITEPSRADVLEYRDGLLEKYKASTVQGYMTAVKLFFRWTDQENLYPNIADHIKGARISREHKKDYLTGKQTQNLLTSIERNTKQGKRDYAIVLLMIAGGLRDIEVSRANVSDLTTKGNETVLYLQGKGRDEREDYIKVIPEAETALREYLALRGKLNGTEPLFTSESNNSKGERLSPRSISQLVKNRLVAAGFNSERLTAHSLRHTAVTLALLGGVPLDEVQQFARHRNIATTQIYAHNLERSRNRSESTIRNMIFTD